jgi:hypothetical protein
MTKERIRPPLVLAPAWHQEIVIRFLVCMVIFSPPYRILSYVMVDKNRLETLSAWANPFTWAFSKL